MSKDTAKSILEIKEEKIYKLLELFSKLPNDKKDIILNEASIMFQEVLNSSQ